MGPQCDQLYAMAGQTSRQKLSGSTTVAQVSFGHYVHVIYTDSSMVRSVGEYRQDKLESGPQLIIICRNMRAHV